MRITRDDLTKEQIERIFSYKFRKNQKQSNADDSMQFIGTKEIAKLMKCSVPVARQIMHRKDFPLIMCGKNLRVMKSEFIKWASQRRD